MGRYLATFLAAASIGTASFPANSQTPAITQQCLNAIREHALRGQVAVTMNARVVRELGLGEAAYSTRNMAHRR